MIMPSVSPIFNGLSQAIQSKRIPLLIVSNLVSKNNILIIIKLERQKKHDHILGRQGAIRVERPSAEVRKEALFLRNAVAHRGHTMAQRFHSGRQAIADGANARLRRARRIDCEPC